MSSSKAVLGLCLLVFSLAAQAEHEETTTYFNCGAPSGVSGKSNLVIQYVDWSDPVIHSFFMTYTQVQKTADGTPITQENGCPIAAVAQEA